MQIRDGIIVVERVRYMKKKILFVIAMMLIFTSGAKALEGEYEQEYTVNAINQYDEQKNSETLYHLIEKKLR